MIKDFKKITLKLKKGRTEYFDEFYDATKKGVYFTVRSIVKDYSLAQDVMQDVYCAFLDKIDGIDADKNVYAYLITAARNRALNALKKDSKLVPLEYCENAESFEPESFSPLLDFARANLPPDDWRILKLTVVDGYNRAETAKLLNRPVSTVSRRYNAILKKVEKMYKAVYDEKV